MIIGITGHKGILGKSIIKYLKQTNNRKYKIIVYKNDILEFDNLKKWIQKLDVILHLAAITDINKVKKNKKYSKKVNYESVKFISNYIKNNNLNVKIIFLSSSHVYASSKKNILENSKLYPISYYGKLKLKSENEIRKKISNYLIIRLFSYYSDQQEDNFLIPSLIKKIKNLNDKKLKLKNYNHIRDFSSIYYVTENICKIIFNDSKGIINCGSGNGFELQQLAKQIAKKKFNKVIFLDKRFKTKNKTRIVSNITKLKKINKIKTKHNFFDNF